MLPPCAHNGSGTHIHDDDMTTRTRRAYRRCECGEVTDCTKTAMDHYQVVHRSPAGWEASRTRCFRTHADAAAEANCPNPRPWNNTASAIELCNCPEFSSQDEATP